VTVAISVVIPHYNQPDLLDRCLASLARQDISRDRFEVMVVDNGSTRLPQDVVARFPGVRLLSETEKGPGPARNRGVAEANGDLFAFIDADMTVAPDWLSAILRAFEDPAKVILGGDVRIDVARPEHPTALECYEAEFGYRMEHYIRFQNFTGTGNLAVRRRVLDDVGPFAGIGVAEDRDWGHRATAKGYPITWAPGIVAFHPARTSFAELARKWDRSTAHDFGLRVSGVGSRLRWGLRGLALAASPVAGLPRILRSDRIPGGLAGRLRAFAVLVRIRLYRARLTLGLLFATKPGDMAGRWRDQG
jgi:GT2 family glycosyltransferase